MYIKDIIYMDDKQKQQPSQVKQNIQKEIAESIPSTSQGTLTFFNDPSSPFQKTNPRLKQFLLKYKQNEKLAIGNIDMNELGYQAKPTANNICSRFFQIGQKFFVCKDCTFLTESTMCLCTSCFEPEKHQGHTVIQQINKHPESFCDCGRVQSIRKQSFCKMHSLYNQEIPCQFNQLKSQQFIQTFDVLLLCAFYLQKNKILYQKICNYLCTLNQKSIYYNRLTFEVLSKNTQTIFFGEQQSLNIIKSHYILISTYCQTNKLVIQINGDLRTRKQFIKFVGNILMCLGQMGADIIQKILPQNYFYQVFDIAAVLQLIQEGYNNPTLDVVFAKGGASEEFSTALKIYMGRKINSFTNIKQIFAVRTQLIKGEIAMDLLLKMIQLYPSDQQINEQTINEYGEIQNNSIRLLPEDIKTANVLVLKFALLISINNAKDLLQIRQIISSKIGTQELDRIINWLVYSIKHIISSQLTLSQFLCVVAFVLLLKGSEHKKQITSKFWKMVFKSSLQSKQKQITQKNGVFPYTQIHFFSNFFVKIITILVNVEIYRILEKKKSFISSKKQFLTNEQQQTMAYWLKTFLYQRKVIKKEIIIQMKVGGIFQFKNASKILNQLCTYEPNQQLFFYTSPFKFQDIICKFPFVISKENFNVIYAIKIHFGMQPKLQQNSLCEILINQLFDCQQIIPLVQAEWQRYMNSVNKNDGKYMYAYLYFFILITYDIFTQGKNRQLRKKLEEIQKNEQMLSNFSSKPEQIKQLKRLLNMQNHKQTPNKLPQESKQQSQQKIQPTITVQQNQQNIMVQRSPSETQVKQPSPIKPKIQSAQSPKKQQIINWTQICVICKQKQKQDNDLAFLGLINKNSTGCNAIYGKNCLTGTSIFVCFHKIHINCYASVKKSQIFAFECPVCQSIKNCIMPIRYMKQKQRLNKMCSNSVILAVLAIYQFYEVQDIFMLVFKHLVEQNGLKSILMMDHSQNKKQEWQANNLYLRVLAIDMFKNSSQKGKRLHQRHVQEFIQQLHACENQQCRLIQQTLASLYKSIIFDRSSEVDLDKIKQIKNLIDENQFNLLKTQIQKILLKSIILESQIVQNQTTTKKKIGFYLVALPKTAQQMAKKYLGKLCQNEDNQQISCVCLICSKLLCSKCRPKHFLQNHNDITVCFSFEKFMLQFSRMNCPSSYPIYFNQYKITIQQGIKHKMGDTEYFLDAQKYKKLVRTYLYI